MFARKTYRAIIATNTGTGERSGILVAAGARRGWWVSSVAEVTRSPEDRPIGVKGRGWWRLLLAGVVAAYVGLQVMYFLDGRPGSAVGPSDPVDGGVLVELTVVSIDPAAKTMTVDVDLELSPVLLGGAATSGPAAALTVWIVPTTTASPVAVAPGAPLVTTRVVVPFETGHIRDWPFDRYSGPVVVTAASGPTGAQPLPTRLSVTGDLQGWDLNVQAAPDPADDLGAFATVALHRSVGVVLFGATIVLVLITLPVLALIVVIDVYRGRRKFEPAFLSWIAALLFATIPIRNFLPGSPPAGSWVDVSVVLWVIVTLAVALVIGAASWRRHTPLQDKRHEPEVSDQQT